MTKILSARARGLGDERGWHNLIVAFAPCRACPASQRARSGAGRPTVRGGATSSERRRDLQREHHVGLVPGGLTRRTQHATRDRRGLDSAGSELLADSAASLICSLMRGGVRTGFRLQARRGLDRGRPTPQALSPCRMSHAILAMVSRRPSESDRGAGWSAGSSSSTPPRLLTPDARRARSVQRGAPHGEPQRGTEERQGAHRSGHDPQERPRRHADVDEQVDRDHREGDAQ